MNVRTPQALAVGVCQDVIDDSFFLGSWGDWWEEHERNHDRECRIGPRRLRGK
jgi:hypothetical protein